jgi:hypothetical protein
MNGPIGMKRETNDDSAMVNFLHKKKRAHDVSWRMLFKDHQWFFENEGVN